MCSYHRGFFLQKCSEITVTRKCVATPQPEVGAALLLLGLENNQQPVVFLKHEGRRYGTKPFCTPGPPVGPPDCTLLPLHCPASCFLGNQAQKVSPAACLRSCSQPRSHPDTFIPLLDVALPGGETCSQALAPNPLQQARLPSSLNQFQV